MIPFLKQVAVHYHSLGDMERVCFIFPNRRSLVFFRKYLAECVAESRIAMISPGLYTMNDFFYEAASSAQTDSVNLLLELYESYSALNPLHESLDEFIFWGKILLSDFDDVDKYLVKPELLFSNVADFRKMQDNLDYLDSVQLAAIEKFVSHFKTGGKYKEEFRRIWDILLPLYKDFNSRLAQKGMSYEGQVYRRLADRLQEESVVDVLAEAFPNVDKFVFVGLNALNECEKRLMRKMRDARIAEFSWDYSSEWIKDAANKSSFFMSDNVLEFPQAFELDTEGLSLPEINVLSVPSSVGQAKQLPSLITELDAHGIETAVVLADEGQLIPVLNSIPEHIEDINVTMGYPMRGSGLWSLMNEISALQMHARQKDGKWLFYHKQVWAIFSNSILKTIMSEKASEIVAKVRKDARYYIEADEFAGDGLLSAIFKAVVTDLKSADLEQIRRLQDYQCDVLAVVAKGIKPNTAMSMELDFAREYYLAVGRLRNIELSILPATYFRLLDSLIYNAAVPFKGEPLRGLQIMGPLETRALDFKNLIILNCNEGVFPRKNIASSFVPAELRRAFALPTYEYQDAVWAYYFYRLIQRCSHLWLVYDSRTEGVKSGEESRYIKQLEMHFEAKINRYFASSTIAKLPEAGDIPKTLQDVEIIKNKYLSASSLKNYISCPARFYYATVKELSVTEDVKESLDGKMIGNVFHHTMEEFYTQEDKKMTKERLLSLLEGDQVKQTVHKYILQEMNCFELSGRNLIHADIICRYVVKTIERDIEWLDSKGAESINILGLERKLYTEIAGLKFKGIVDRMDSLSDECVRVVDYKTGSVSDNDIIIDEGNAKKVVEDLFGEKDAVRPKIALQLYLYDKMLGSYSEFNGKSVFNSIYQPSKLFVESVRDVRLDPGFVELMDQRVEQTLTELVNPEIPFKRATDIATCEYCDFKTICGR